MSTFDRSKVKEVIRSFVQQAYAAQQKDDFYKNTLDVFSAALTGIFKEQSWDEWVEEEKIRQVQKTLQNKVGELHQKVLATIPDIKDLGTKQILDLESNEKKFVAEIKNKHNTTKGDHLVRVYDAIAAKLETMPEDTIGYFVAILPPNGKKYDEEFRPSDNTKKPPKDATKEDIKTFTENVKRRPSNPRIRKIDGQTFYEKITGNPNALRELYLMLPALISEVLKEESIDKSKKFEYQEFLREDEFDRIYGKKAP